MRQLRSGGYFVNATFYCRATAVTATAAMLMSGAAAAAHGWESSPASVEVFDRTTGATLAVHEKDGQRYVIGGPGHEYMIRIRNQTSERILAVTSVDGVNVISGETAAPGQSGYVIEAHGSVEIAGWRRSLYKTSAFYFTDLHDSYAARTRRPDDVGVIGVAVFRERTPPVTQVWRGDRLAARPESPLPEAPGLNDQRPAADGRGVAVETSPNATRAENGEASRADTPAKTADTLREQAERAAASAAPRPLAKLGTGFGRDEGSLAQRVHFERATETPAQTIAIRYDRYENLAAMGVLPPRHYAEHTPDPFPALRFVAPPR